MSIAQYFQTVVQSITVYSVNYGIVHDLFLQLSLVVWGYVHLWSSVSHFHLLTVCQALFYFYCQQWASLCLPVKAGLDLLFLVTGYIHLDRYWYFAVFVLCYRWCLVTDISALL